MGRVGLLFMNEPFSCLLVCSIADHGQRNKCLTLAKTEVKPLSRILLEKSVFMQRHRIFISSVASFFPSCSGISRFSARLCCVSDLRVVLQIGADFHARNQCLGL